MTYRERYNKIVLDGYRIRAMLLGVPINTEVRYRPDQKRNEAGRFAQENGGGNPKNEGLTNGNGSDTIKKEFELAIESGKISTKLDKKKQGAHIKGNPAYEDRIARGEHPSYVTISKMEIQTVINKTSGTGVFFKRPDGQITEKVQWHTQIGVCVEKHSGKEFSTNNAVIHYSKSGAHIVPSK